jgi:hypothetical protein
LGDRDGYVLDHSNDIGELQADKLNPLRFNRCKNVVVSAWHILILGDAG